MERHDGVRVRNVYVESFADVNAKLVTEGFETPDAREDYLEELGITKAAIKRKSAYNQLPVDAIEKRIHTLEEMGLNARIVMNYGNTVIGCSDFVLQERYDNLYHLGLDAVRVINDSPTVINYSPEDMRDQLVCLADVLSDMNLACTACEVANATPRILLCSIDKIRTNLRLLTDAADADYIATIKANYIGLMGTMPVDGAFAAIATIKSLPDYSPKFMTYSKIHQIQRKLKSAERRRQSIDSICNSVMRKKLGMCAVNIYLDHSPLSEGEANEILDSGILVQDRSATQNRQWFIKNVLSRI